ncbi:MAG: glycosyltransferase [Ignavibacteria bacterium]
MSNSILHIAPQNFAGMPFDFMKMQSEAGYKSRLVTMFQNTLNFEEDLSLDFKLHVNKAAKKWRDSKMTGLKYYEPKNILESTYFKLRDFKNSPKINNFIEEHNLYDYDVYHFDGGMDFFRDLRFAKELKRRGKKIVCCYFGSDLRSRGVFKELDEMSDLNLTVEYDHLQLHKNIHYLFFPFDVKKVEYKYAQSDRVKIIHSPTNRLYKGTEKILAVIDELKKSYDFDFILAEHIPREKLLEMKRECNLSIDQVGGELGGSGYGRNSIENLAMGLPTITEFFGEYLDFLPENPFITCDINNLKDAIVRFIKNPELLKDYSENGRKWVEKYHSYEAVNKRVEELYTEYGI